eukprot:961396-Pyramimonas_sp.AAC.1
MWYRKRILPAVLRVVIEAVHGEDPSTERPGATGSNAYREIPLHNVHEVVERRVGILERFAARANGGVREAQRVALKARVLVALDNVAGQTVTELPRVALVVV